MSPGSSTESYPAFARIGLRENPRKNLNQVTCPDRDSNPWMDDLVDGEARVRQKLNEMFGVHAVGRGESQSWPPWSPDLTPLEFFLW
ncbi:hypothetical protein ANN_11564 [Periplaneta americana]|uniref:Uncharacterized protein n=1 Tax=Periplaneta americana TaxID=6978 RepID=A0ABQ8T6T6_PERAM|nr:hypothetical protein ANN_11564 [Periplaneta americana]